MMVKFINNWLDGQSFLKKVHSVFKSKQISSLEYMTYTDECLTHKNNVIKRNSKLLADTCGSTLTDRNGLVPETHFKNHHGNESRFNITLDFV